MSKSDEYAEVDVSDTGITNNYEFSNSEYGDDDYIDKCMNIYLDAAGCTDKKKKCFEWSCVSCVSL